MRNIKYIKGILFLSIALYLSSCEKKTEIFKMNIYPYKERGLSKYFIVSNPPEDLKSIVFFYQSEVNHFLLKKESLQKEDYYYHSYYKERFFFDRNYKEPKPTYDRILTWNFLFDTRSIEVTHSNDLFIKIIFIDKIHVEKNSPVTPYLYIKKNDLYYFPRGLKNNPNIHWRKGDWIPR